MQLCVSSKVSNFAYVIPGARRSYCFCVLLTTLSCMATLMVVTLMVVLFNLYIAHYFSFVLDFNLKL